MLLLSCCNCDSNSFTLLFNISTSFFDSSFVFVVFVVGGGYAGTTVAKGLDNHFQVTLVTPLDFLQHKYSFLRASVVPGWEQAACVPLDNLLTNGKIVQGKVVSVSEESVSLEDGSVLKADYIVLAHGGGGNLPGGLPRGIVDMVSFRKVLTEKQKLIQNSNNIVVIGAGPVGLELCGEIRAMYPNKSIKVIQSQPQILNNSTPPLVEKFINKVGNRLNELGIEVLLNTKVTNLPHIDNGDGFLTEPRRLNLSNGESIESDLTIVCIGTSSSSSSNLLDSSHLDSSNRIKVDLTFKVEGLRTVYCIGDAANVPETKLGYLAEQQANHLVTNLKKSLQGKPPVQYTPASSGEFGVMFLPLGPIRGVGAMGKTVMGDGMTSKMKGKGLFKNRVFQSRNAIAPNL